MGFFSKIFSDNGKNLQIGKSAYLLVPTPFQEKYGKAIYEPSYDGYGRYGTYNVYELIAEWNKEFIPEIISKVQDGTWKADISDDVIANMQAYYEGKEISCPKRNFIGILMACYDEDNERLQYPIKVTSKEMDYDTVPPSKDDPKQGCR